MSDLSQPPLNLVPQGLEDEPRPDGALHFGGALRLDRPAGPAGTEPFAWPTPPDAAYPAPVRQTAPEPCELESLQGRVNTGTLMLLNPVAGVVTVRMVNGHRTLTLRFSQFRRLTLLRALPPQAPPRAPGPDDTTPTLPRRSLVWCRVVFKDGAESVFCSVGHVETPVGWFTFRPLDDDGAVERSFHPRKAVAEFAISEYPPTTNADAAHIDADATDSTVPMALLDAGDASSLTILSEPLSLVGMPSRRAESAPAGPAASAAPRQVADPVTAERPPAAPTVPSAAAAALGAQQFIVEPDALMAAISQQARMPMVRIGEALLALGYISEAKLGDALAAQSQDRSLPLGELLVRRGDISREDLQTALARKMGYPIIDAVNFPVDPGAALHLPVSLARRLVALPVLYRTGQLVVALEDPSARAAIDEIEFSAQCKVVTVLARAGTLAHAIEVVYQRLGEDAIEPSADLIGGLALESDSQDSNRLLANMEQQSQAEEDDGPQIEQSDNQLVRLINTMIMEARVQGVSDIHIECPPSPEKVRVRFRKDGVLRLHLELPHTYRNAMVARLKIMCDLDISERRKPQDGKINFGRYMQGQKLELRVATIPTANGLEDVVMRLLASARALPLDGMGIQPDTLQRLKDVIARPYGMVLCVGPTGSGKTTTLHAALAHINTPDRKIWTAEDPVEITQSGLRQVQVNPKIDWTFAKALRAFLRADPDVVMVGEIRDAETAHMAIEASLTGHLVLSTLHTNSAPETVTRLLDMGMDPFSFADSLLAVLAQRLVRRWCRQCVTSSPATPEVTEALLDEYLFAQPDPARRPDREALRTAWLDQFGSDGVLMHHHAPGCAHCGKSGYAGRVGLHELLVVSRELRRLIQTSARAEELQGLAMVEGMRTLRQDGILKVLAGMTSIEEVRATSNG